MGVRLDPCWMPVDGPDDRDTLAEVEIDHGERGTELSPWTWLGILVVLVMSLVLLVLLL